jgi:hypothetical protein
MSEASCDTVARLSGAPPSTGPGVHRKLARASLALLAAACLAAVALPGPGTARADPTAVGRLNYAGYKARQHCTAFLTDAGHLVTAAHCLSVPEDASIHFLQGYDRGHWRAHVLLDPSHFRIDAARDTAVACDAAPADAVSHGQTLRLVAQPPRLGEGLFAWGYGAPRSQMRQEAACRVDGWRPEAGAMHLTCRLSSGASGGPVVRRLPDGTYDAVGVISRSGSEGSVAAAIDRAGLARLCRR